MEQIINGVDDFGCKYNEENTEVICLLKCNETKDCYYKQLRRKEVECEGLNIIIDRLLEKGGYDKNTCNDYDFEDIYSDIEYKINKLEEYKQALDEIEKIVEKYSIENPNTIISNPLEELCSILQIIQKVKGE